MMLMKASIVFRDESGSEGGTAHPTQDLISELEKYMEVEEVPVNNPSSSNPLYWYRLGKKASKESDIVHVQFEYTTFGSIGGIFLGIMYPFFALGVSVPMVTTFFNLKRRNVSLSGFNSILSSAVLLAKSPIDIVLVRETDYFIPFIKEHERLLEEKGAPSESVERFPFVAEPEPEFLDPKMCKEYYGVSDKQVITAFGWVRRSKGYHHIIEAMNYLPEDSVFLIAGGTRIEAHEEYLQELKQQVKKLNLEERVIFTGYVPREEHSKVMNATDIMVFPYQDNRPSAALAAALSYNLPILASDSEVFRTFEEEWGCIRTFSNPEELNEELHSLLTNKSELQQLRKRSKEYSNEVNPNSFAKKLWDIYQTVADAS